MKTIAPIIDVNNPPVNPAPSRKEADFPNRLPAKPKIKSSNHEGLIFFWAKRLYKNFEIMATIIAPMIEKIMLIRNNYTNFSNIY